jgi:hypothetical protein
MVIERVHLEIRIGKEQWAILQTGLLWRKMRPTPRTAVGNAAFLAEF